ncbi:MAG: cation diffusion facilitator family transporter [Puniceicoccaceae bacterium]
MKHTHEAMPPTTADQQTQHNRDDRRWMSISLAVAVVLLVVKLTAFALTRSTAILGDAVESIVHLLAVVFAFYSVRISQRPADRTHPYGHAKISFFSSGFEGLMITLAALYIAWEAIAAWIRNTEVLRISDGLVLSMVVLVSNLILGFLLLRVAKRTRSIIVRANGLHILTDAWTSVGVWVALLLVHFTGWNRWDPIVGMLIAINIFVTGYRLMLRGFDGLMDRADPAVAKKLHETLEASCAQWNISYHRLKFRDVGDTLDIDVDLLFPDQMSIKQAHEIATDIEQAMAASIQGKAIISTHLEPAKHHAQIHPSKQGNPGKN